MSDGHLILAAGALLAAGLLASLLAVRLRVPSLLLFLAVGMLVGSDVLGWIQFNDYRLARTIGVIALALILFEGGLTGGLLHLRPVLGAATSLAFVGTLITAAITGVAAGALFGFSAKQGLLLGAILSSTDGAAIFALLRGSTLSRKLARTLEGETGLNDPVAVLLVVGFIDLLTHPGYDAANLVWLFARELGIGLIVGVAIGWLGVFALRRARLATAGLYPVASLALAALAYGGADVLHGSGFLAVYLAGVMVGSATVPAEQTIVNFHQGLGWVAQVAMFLTLGLLVSPSQLGSVAVKGTVLALIVVFVARPPAAALATLPFAYTWRERIVLGWAGLRGAVPVVLATFPVVAGVSRSLEFFNIVFFAVLVSTLLQGTTFESIAQRLKLTTTEPALPRPLAESGTIRRLGAEVLEYPVAPGDAIAGARVRDLGLPRDAVVNVIVRDEKAIPPRGSTLLVAGDRLHILISEESAHIVRDLVDRWRRGPIGPPPRPPRRVEGRRPIFTVWTWDEDRDGDPARPNAIGGHEAIEQLRIRRDQPGGLWVLADGRYAVTGPLAAVGSRGDLTEWARRRMRRAPAEEVAWLQTVIGALASDRSN
ncbi:MAG: potassium/proton antiporter [Solirubrobacterales bacterium]|nr:potassium/proton antiporter [Solirubrobacterales bacterium]MBV9425470.1 potassium/proton antiporter [Solirubrobacterales bacterium]MBV9799007.1 potassium/proton antiporter [Solirubrobacterales bacterium]